MLARANVFSAVWFLLFEWQLWSHNNTRVRGASNCPETGPAGPNAVQYSENLFSFLPLPFHPLLMCNLISKAWSSALADFSARVEGINCLGAVRAEQAVLALLAAPGNVLGLHKVPVKSATLNTSV